ncbi:MAG: hypothetical protein WA964_06395 [Ilumatobacter sp.]|uniref:hypothetical protein n=1 Tax=Ilumatobacter sp. TaxID=1967498 RepID=UPI003C78F02C
MAGKRACFVLVLAGLVAASCSSGGGDGVAGSASEPVSTSDATGSVAPDAGADADPADGPETGPSGVDVEDAAVVALPPGPLYLPSEMPDGWSIRSVTTLPNADLERDGEVARLAFVAHPVTGGFAAAGISVNVVKYSSTEFAEAATAMGQLGFDASPIAVAGYGDGLVEDQFDVVGLAALSVAQGAIGVAMVGQKPVAELVAVAEGLRIETDGAGASETDVSVALDLADWELADNGSPNGSYIIEIGGPGGSMEATVSPDQSRSSLYLSGGDFENSLEGDTGEGYLAIQRVDDNEFPRIVWWVPDVRLTGFPTSDPGLVVSVLDSFVEVDEATFIDRTAEASFVTIEPEQDAPEPPPPAANGASPRPFDDGRLDVLTGFVEDFVGRPFVTQPEVSLIDRTSLTGEVPPGTFVSESQWNLYRSLGLISPDADRTDAESVRIEQVRGVCCPVQVVEQPDPGFNEVVIVHELTHGLDTELAASSAATDEPTDARRALVEGNAHRVAFAYRDVLAEDGADLPEPPAVFSNVDDPRLPEAIRELLEFPYDEGRLFARALVDLDGEQAIVDAFAEPPSTSEQILDVEAYLAGEIAAPVAVPNPPEGSAALSTGSIGAFTLRLLLEQSLEPDAASAVGATWSGDQYSLYGDSDAPCIVATIVVDDETAAEQLEAALRIDAADISENEVVRNGTTVSLTRCAA